MTLRQRIKWLHELDLRHINKQFVSLSLNTKPDLVIFTGGHRIQLQSVITLRENGITMVLWTTDAPVNFGPIMTAVHCYNHIFCGGTVAHEILEKTGNLAELQVQWIKPVRNAGIVRSNRKRSTAIKLIQQLKLPHFHWQSIYSTILKNCLKSHFAFLPPAVVCRHGNKIKLLSFLGFDLRIMSKIKRIYNFPVWLQQTMTWLHN